MARTQLQQMQDKEALSYAKTKARDPKFATGTFTARQTGAKKLAEDRKNYADMGEMMKSLETGTSETENYIKTGKYKKGR